MKRLRAAVIGVGYLGNFHAQKYKTLSQSFPVDLVGVCDSNPTQAQKIASELGVEAFSSPKDLIGKVDLVSIATVTSVHFEVAKLCLENSIHVNVEKPMTVTTKEALELIALAKKNNLVLCVGHSERFNPAFVQLQKLVPNPMALEFIRHAPYKSRGADVSVLHDLLIHDLDLLFSMDGSEARLVSAQMGKIVSPTPDWVLATFEFSSGMKAQLSVHRVAKEMSRIVRAYDKNSAWTANLQTGDVEKTNISADKSQVTVETQSLGRGDNLLLENQAFVQAVLKTQPAVITGQDGLRALEWVEKIIALADGPSRGR